MAEARRAGGISAAVGRPITYVEAGRAEIRADLVAAGVPPEFADPVSDFYVYALTSGAFGVLSGDMLAVTGRPPVSFAEYAAGAAPAWRR